MNKNFDKYSNNELIKELAERGISAAYTYEEINKHQEEIKKAAEMAKAKKRVETISARNNAIKALALYISKVTGEDYSNIHNTLSTKMIFELVQFENFFKF